MLLVSSNNKASLIYLIAFLKFVPSIFSLFFLVFCDPWISQKQMIFSSLLPRYVFHAISVNLIFNAIILTKFEFTMQYPLIWLATIQEVCNNKAMHDALIWTLPRRLTKYLYYVCKSWTFSCLTVSLNFSFSDNCFHHFKVQEAKSCSWGLFWTFFTFGGMEANIHGSQEKVDLFFMLLFFIFCQR